MSDLEFRELEIFCRVVEHQGFTRAARVVHLSQAAVSERIASLERAVGARLLDRLGRRAEPTAVGRLLYDHARELLAYRRRVDQDLSGFLGIAHGQVVLGASTIPGEYLLPGVVARFREDRPAVRVELRITGSAAVAAGVLAGELELGVVGAPPESPRLHATPLWRDELVLVLPANHPLGNEKRLDPSVLRNEPLLVREPGSGTRRLTEEALIDAGIEPETLDVVAELGSTAAVKEGVLQGLGISVISSRAVAREVEVGLLRAVPLEAALERRFQLVLDERRATSPLAQALVEHIVQRAR